MPRLGEKFTSELSWQEELGLEPVGGYPSPDDMIKKTNDDIIKGLIAFVESRDNKDTVQGKYWELYSNEFHCRIVAPRINAERMEVSVPRIIAQLLKRLGEFKNLADTPL